MLLYSSTIDSNSNHLIIKIIGSTTNLMEII